MKKSSQHPKLLFTLAFLIFSVISAVAQDVYEIKFTSHFTQYRVALVLYSNGTGTARVRYYSEGKTRMVEQSIVLQTTTSGYRLTGYTPVYPNTSVRYPSYIADNFYVSQNEYGTVSCINIDDKGDRAVCSFRLITGYYSKNSFLSDFDWKIN